MGAEEGDGEKVPAATNVIAAPEAQALIAKGQGLFLRNCAHCHARDASGDEGPDLHGVKKSDARIAAMVKNGVPGEMPRFGSKLSDAEVAALIAFVRSLSDRE